MILIVKVKNIQEKVNLRIFQRYVNKETLKEQHSNQQNRKSCEINKITKMEYGQDLDTNIENLLERMKTLSYKPKPVRRTYILKANGKKSGLGIPSYENR